MSYKLTTKLIDHKGYAVSPYGDLVCIHNYKPTQIAVLKAEFEKLDIEKKIDDLVEWLIENELNDPEFNTKLSQLRELEHKYKVLNDNTTDHGGLQEVSVPRKVPTSQNYK